MELDREILRVSDYIAGITNPKPESGEGTHSKEDEGPAPGGGVEESKDDKPTAWDDYPTPASGGNQKEKEPPDKTDHDKSDLEGLTGDWDSAEELVPPDPEAQSKVVDSNVLQTATDAGGMSASETAGAVDDMASAMAESVPDVPGIHPDAQDFGSGGLGDGQSAASQSATAPASPDAPASLKSAPTKAGDQKTMSPAADTATPPASGGTSDGSMTATGSEATFHSAQTGQDALPVGMIGGTRDTDPTGRQEGSTPPSETTQSGPTYTGTGNANHVQLQPGGVEQRDVHRVHFGE